MHKGLDLNGLYGHESGLYDLFLEDGIPDFGSFHQFPDLCPETFHSQAESFFHYQG